MEMDQRGKDWKGYIGPLIQMGERFKEDENNSGQWEMCEFVVFFLAYLLSVLEILVLILLGVAWEGLVPWPKY